MDRQVDGPAELEVRVDRHPVQAPGDRTAIDGGNVIAGAKAGLLSGRSGVLLGALVGTGIGVGWAAINCDLAHENTDFPCKSVFAVVGAEFGGAVGFIVSLRR